MANIKVAMIVGKMHILEKKETMGDPPPPPDGICESQWGLNRCPNKAAYIIKNLDNLGFAVMCEVHKDVFQEETDGRLRVKYTTYDQELAIELYNTVREAEEAGEL